MAGKGFFNSLNSWKVVLLSLLGATTFWFFNELNKEYTTRLIYPLKFNFERDSVVVVRPMPTSIKVDVTGGGWNLLRRTFILFNPTPLTIDLDNPTLIRFYSRATLLPLVRDQLSELRVNYLMTDTIYFHIEEKLSRKLPVSIDSANIDLREDYRIVSSMSFSPDSIVLTGPKSFIDSLNGPFILPISERAIDEDYDEDVEILLPAEEITLSEPEEINVSFAVERFDRITVPVPFDVLNFPEDSTAIPGIEQIEVSFTVPRSERREYEASDFGITVDFNLLNEGDSSIFPIMIYSPEETIEIDMVPDTVKVLFIVPE